MEKQYNLKIDRFEHALILYAFSMLDDSEKDFELYRSTAKPLFEKLKTTSLEILLDMQKNKNKKTKKKK